MSRYAFPIIFILAIVLITGGCSGGDPVTSPDRGDNSDAAIGAISDEQSTNPALCHPWDADKWPDAANGPQWIEGEVLVVLHDNVDASALYPMARKLGLTLRKEIKLMWGTVYKLTFDPTTSMESMVAELLGNPEVRYAEPNIQYYPCAVPYYPNDPLFEFDGDSDDDPWTYKYDQWGPNVLGASLCWPTSPGSGDIAIAVLDTGIRWSHEDLANQIWNNEDEIPGNGIDDDDNGYIDDYRGWDFAGNDGDPWDTHSHGTGCSGCVVAEMDNGVGCAGIAPGVKVMPLRTNLANDEVIEGAQYAYDNGATAVSMSFHTYQESQIMHNTFIAVWDDGNGMLPLASAGNDNSSTDTWPNSWPECVRIGATCSYAKGSGERRNVVRTTPADYGWGSNWGEKLEVMAPGYLFISTHYGGDAEYYDGVERGTFGGTSCSCPVTAGVVGLIASAHPDWTALQLRDRLKGTCDDLYTDGHDDQSGWGRINAWRAVYGSEPNESIYDVNGHIPVDSIGTWQYDSIFDISTSADYDFEDIFALEAGSDGVFIIEMDVITTGENFDMELFLNSELSGVPVGTGYGPNDHVKPGETISLLANEGDKFYLRVYSPEPYNTSNFRVRSYTEPFDWWLEWKSLAPIFVLDGSPALPLLQVEIHTNLLVTFDTVRAYIAGDIPIGLVNNLYLYEDTNDSGTWESAEDETAGIAAISDGPVNQAIFDQLIAVATYKEPLRYFLVADVGPNELGYNVEIGIGLRSYKDIEIWQNAQLRTDPFPIFSDFTVVGQDHEPPVWDDTVGVQLAIPKYKKAILYWNSATDVLTPPTDYNVYWDDEFPPEISTGCMIEDISTSGGGDDYDYKGTVSNLTNELTYYFCIRARDTMGNEDDNEVWLECTPDAIPDPEVPETIGSIDPGGNCWEVWVYDQIAYLACGDSGVQIVDCTIPHAPSLIDSYPGNDCFGIQYHEGQGYIYASDNDGLMIIDPDGTEGPELVGSYPISEALDVFVDGTTCYVGNEAGRLYVLDVTDPSAPVHQDDISLGNNQAIYGISARDGYAYCTTGSAGLKIVNAIDPTDISVAKTLTLNNYTYEITLHGDYALVTNWWYHRVYVVDISDPPNAFSEGSLNFSWGYGAGVAVRDDTYVYVGRYNSSVLSIDWSDFEDIHKVGELWTNGPDGLFYDGTYLYAAENEHGLKIIL